MVIDIPEFGQLELNHLVLDYNGTIAHDGKLIEAIKGQIVALSECMEIHVVTADTHGCAKTELDGLPVTLHILKCGEETAQKRIYIEKLGATHIVAIGNGCNDAEMLKHSRVGICVLGSEGCTLKAAMAADVLVRSIEEGLGLLIYPLRLKATLRG